MWSEIILNPDNPTAMFSGSGPINYNELFENLITPGLYTDFLKELNNNININSPPADFNTLQKDEKSFWVRYVLGIPEKFLITGLFIRPFIGFCRTCIITDAEIDVFVNIDKTKFKSDTQYIQKKFPHSFKKPHQFYQELNYLIPTQFRKAGYEIIRKEEADEIDISVIRKLARAIHSKYLQGIKTQKANLKDRQSDTSNLFLTDFDDLALEIQYSNLDNSSHIPAKLLSIGYKIRPVRKDYNPQTLSLNEVEIETMAKLEHLRWSWEKRLNGWRHGNKRDNNKKLHPSLIYYAALDESEKEKDRELVKLIPSLLHDINYETYPVSPNRIRNVSYVLKPQSIIQRLLSDIRKLSDEVESLIVASPEINDKILSINSKIEETIKEVAGGFSYAQHIQEVFLPEDLYIRECFPESFVLYKPKNIVSGDFYFFSKQGNVLLFALADCTGHGIPGALISTLAYSSLDQTVNVMKLSDPAEILRNVYLQIHRFFRRNSDQSGLQDDMDITMCHLDTETNILTYSGVGNLFYFVSNGKIIEIKSEYFKEDSNPANEYLFASNKLQLKNGDNLYISSDGYADQLGGKNRKRYQRKTLMDLLFKIHNSPMAEQSDMLYEEIEQWREEYFEEQTDDISIIGIRI